MQRWYEDTQPWHNETPIKQTDKTEMKALFTLMDFQGNFQVVSSKELSGSK